MEEIAQTLRRHPPFHLVPFNRLLEACSSIQIEYFPAGHEVLRQGDTPTEFLYIIQRGAVDLIRDGDPAPHIVDTLGPGESFGYVSLTREQAPILTVRTRNEVLAYLLPAETFHQLRHDVPPFGQFFAASSVERISHALDKHSAGAEPALFQMRMLDLVQQQVIMVAPTTTVREAARVMRDHNVSSLLVDVSPPGILTDRDLRNHVLAIGLSDQTPVAEVMNAPALTMPGESLVFEGLLLMLERGIHHMPITEDDRVVGLITDTDILRQQSRSPLFLPRQLIRARTLDDLRDYTDQVSATVGALLDAGARVSDIGRVVAVANDALQRRLLQEAELKLGAPPCPYAWIVLGSQGRFEQTLRTDQDNAIIYADDAPPGAAGYFTELAEQMVGSLESCGFPRCPGMVLATNPDWRQPLHIWQNYFRHWIQTPQEEALLKVSIFFDYRQIYGDLEVAAALHPITHAARGQRIFLGRLARAALRHAAPLTFFRQLVLEQRNGQRNLLDLKMRGTAMVVDLARLFALEAGIPATSTVTRLRDASGHGTLNVNAAEELAAAFELLSLIRLRQHHHQIERGEEPTNVVAIDTLSSLERRELKEVIQAIGRIQRAVGFAFQTDRMA